MCAQRRVVLRNYSSIRSPRVLSARAHAPSSQFSLLCMANHVAAASAGCSMRGRTDLRMYRSSAQPVWCSSAKSKDVCESFFRSGGIDEADWPTGYTTPCVWHAGVCRLGERVRCNTLDEWHACPANVNDMWQRELHGFEAAGSATTTERWSCHNNGSFWPLSYAKLDTRGPSRHTALTMTPDACAKFPWSGSTRIRPGARAIFGLDNDVRHIARPKGVQNASVFALSMPMTASYLGRVTWTPCTNFAFTLCAARGLLHGGGGGTLSSSPAGGELYLATRGADIATRCSPAVVEHKLLHQRNLTCTAEGCRRFDATWDECYVTKSEYCTLSRACANGHEVWNASGIWRCLIGV